MRALLSVYDKTGLEGFARALAALGFELLASGGTAAALAAAGIPHRRVEEVTGAPEMLGGRVKTLHPAVHGAILADRGRPEHLEDLSRAGIDPIDLVACNLYPFAAEPSIEMIDVGGPTMVRAAAKNHEHVTVIVDPGDYGAVVDELRREGGVSLEVRRRLARKAFAHTAAYDAAIVAWLDRGGASGEAKEALPPTLHLALERVQELRYGENPHQHAARYRDLVGPAGFWERTVQHSGRELSYLNLVDTEAAWRLVHELADLRRPGAAAVIVKHANPCGAAVADDAATAYEWALAGDPVSAFGGIVALSVPVDAALAARLLEGPLADVLVAPGYEEGVPALLAGRRKNTRVLEAPLPSAPGLSVRQVDGGFLVQEPDRVVSTRERWRVVTRRAPAPHEWADLELAWRACARTTSNAVVLAAAGALVGVGAGQQSRVDAAGIAVRKAGARATGACAASDAFFPFRDGLDVLADAGVAAVVQPGGSLRDDEVVAAADERGLAMVVTGERHFRH